MRRAIVSFGSGPFADLLEIARPSFQAFADRYGWKLLKARPPKIEGPASWLKLPIISKALLSFDQVLWLDADTLIVDDRDDLELPEGYSQAFVEHRTRDGRVPNCGVWLVGRPMFPVLARLWEMRDRYLNHVWWEQAALCELLGYQGRRLGGSGEVRPVEPSSLHEASFLLDPSWNVHVNDRQDREADRILHATCLPNRAEAMRAWAGQVPSAA